MVKLESHSYNAMKKNTSLVCSIIHSTSNIAEALLAPMKTAMKEQGKARQGRESPRE